MTQARGCIVNIILSSMLSTYIDSYVRGPHDSEIINPLSLTISMMLILPISQAPCLSTQYHLSSLCISYFLEQN